MSGIQGIPDFIYIDEARINQRLQFVDEGHVAEIVEKYSGEETKTRGGGLNIYNVFNYQREKTSGESEEVARTIQTTPPGQLAVFFGLMDMENGVNNIDGLTPDERDELIQGEHVVFSGRIQEPPIAKMARVLEMSKTDIDELADQSDDDDEVNTEVVKSEFNDASEYLQIQMTEIADGRYVFRLNPENMTGIERDFPSSYKDYTVFGRIEHAFEGRERQHHVSIFNEMNINDRQKKNERRRKRKKIANKMSPLYDEPIDESIFYIESPDILINPIAVYS